MRGARESEEIAFLEQQTEVSVKVEGAKYRSIGIKGRFMNRLYVPITRRKTG